MRVAVVDIGTNSTRLLVADVALDGALTELERRSTVTRLGQGVDATGRLDDAAMARVFATLVDYRRAIDAHGAGPNIAVLTSAVRDAANGPEFTQEVRDRYELDAHTIAGEQEARLTFVGATSERDDQAGDGDPLVVIDVGGGSTEFIVGSGRVVAFHVSTQAGVVRQSERHIASDPPRPEELEALAEDARQIIAAGVPHEVRAGVTHAIAVAGTATSLGAIDLELDPYDPERVHGHRVSIQRAEELLHRLAAMTDDQRRHVTGLHPDRAPTIVAGAVLLIEALRAFELGAFEISEHDILRGAALQLANVSRDD